MAQIPDKRTNIEYVEGMLERNRWGDARVALLRADEGLDPIANRRDIEWVEFYKVLCAMELGSGDVTTMMDNYMERFPTSIYSHHMPFMMACYECDRGNIEQAKELFKRVDYTSLDAYERERYDIRVGYLNFLDGDYNKASLHLKRITPMSEYYHHALYYNAYIAYSLGYNDEAERIFRQLANYETYDMLSPFYLLQIEYRRGNYDYVITEGERLMTLVSDDTYADLVRIIAESYFIKGDYANAIRYASNMPKEHMSRQMNYIMGYSLYRMARYETAIEPLRMVCGADDALTQNASYHLGDCYLRVGNKSKAADAFAMASVEGFDDDIARDALLNTGRLKFELGGGIFNESVNVLQYYLKRYPDSAYSSEVKELLIAAFYNSEDYDSAYNAIHELPNPDSDILAVLQKVAVFRAIKAIDNNQWDEADELLNEAKEIGIVPKYNALILYWQGEVAYHKGDIERAKQCYEDYIRRAPKSEMEYHFAHYGLGYVYLAMNNMKEAQSAFTNFVRDYTMRDSYLYDAHNRLGDAYFADREFADARKIYNIVAQAPADERYYALYQLAKVDGVDKKPKAKIDRLKSIVSDNEGAYVDDAWYELGRTYITMEKYSDGAKTLQEFVDSDTLSPYYVPALSDLALAYYNLGRKDSARECYEKVVDYDPESAAALEAVRGIREIYMSQGRVDEYFAYAERKGLQSDMSAAARDSITFAAAKSLYLNGDIDDACKKLNNYLESFTSGYNRTEALFYLSDCYVALGKSDEALTAMRNLLDHGKTQYTERVLDVYSRMSYDRGDYENSAKAYRELYNISHEVKQREIVSEGYVEATLKFADNNGIKSLADDVDKMKNASDWARRRSKLAKADVLRQEGNIKNALDIYNDLSKDKRSLEGAEAYYRLVEYDYNSGNYERAEKRVYSLGECGSMYWQAKIYLVLGDVLVKMGNTFQARATYQSIVDGYSPKDDGIVDEAKQRIASLSK
jgi:TolA-binding protein